MIATWLRQWDAITRSVHFHYLCSKLRSRKIYTGYFKTCICRNQRGFSLLVYKPIIFSISVSDANNKQGHSDRGNHKLLHLTSIIRTQRYHSWSVLNISLFEALDWSTNISSAYIFQDRSMDYQTPTKPRALTGNNTANLKSFRSVVLGKDGVGKSGIVKPNMSSSDIFYTCLFLLI